MSVALCALYCCFSPFLNVYTGPKLDANGFCQLYRGAACSKFIAGRSIYVTENDQQGRMEDRMKGACRACVCMCTCVIQAVTAGTLQLPQILRIQIWVRV